MYEAMDMGCDIAGGMPAAEWLDELKLRHVDFVFDMAGKVWRDDRHAHRPVQGHVRPLARVYRVEDAREGLERPRDGRALHSITYQNQSHAIKVMKLIKEAGMNICTNTQVLAIRASTRSPARAASRASARWSIWASTSPPRQDTICDGFHLYGTGDPLDYGPDRRVHGPVQHARHRAADVRHAHHPLHEDLRSGRELRHRGRQRRGSEHHRRGQRAGGAAHARVPARTSSAHGKVIASFERKATLY